MRVFVLCALHETTLTVRVRAAHIGDTLHRVGRSVEPITKATLHITAPFVANRCLPGPSPLTAATSHDLRNPSTVARHEGHWRRTMHQRRHVQQQFRAGDTLRTATTLVPT